MTGHGPRRRFFRVAAAGLLVSAFGAAGIVLADQGRREFDVLARKYSYQVAGLRTPEIRVTQNDLVRINFSTGDIPHSFTIEDTAGSHYRIMKRAEPGKPVSFDFRADTAGTFRFYCSLTIDEGCRKMEGQLIVAPAAEARAAQPPAVPTLLQRPAARQAAGG